MKFHYKGFGNCNCVCEVEIDKKNSIVVFIELSENTGTSITNVIEVLYYQFAISLKKQIHELTVFELYDERSYTGKEAKEDRFNNVSLVTLYETGGRYLPEWKFFERSEFLDFLKTVGSDLHEIFI